MSGRYVTTVAARYPNRFAAAASLYGDFPFPAFVPLVAVFVDPPSSLVDEALKSGAVPQFHGYEHADWCEAFAAGQYLKAYHVRDDEPLDAETFARFARPFEHATWLFDTARADGRSGGAGRTFRWEIAPALALAMVIFFLSLAGIPPTAGFIGKFLVFGAALEAAKVGGPTQQLLIWLAIIGAVNSVVSVGYYFNIVRYMFFLPPKEETPVRVAPTLNWLLGFATLMTLLLGIVPQPFLIFAQ